MGINLNRLTKGEPDWHLPLNQNADRLEAALEDFTGGGSGLQTQLDEIRAIAESRLPKIYEDGVNVDTLTDAAAYGVKNPDFALVGNDVAMLTLRGGDDSTDKLHQIAFPFTADGKAPSMHTRTNNNGVWTDWKLRASGAKLLWSGSWKSGAITIPSLDDYCGFIMTLEGQGTTMPVYRVPGSGFMRGMNGYSSATPTIVSYHFAATVVGKTLTFVACNNMTHNPSGTHGVSANNTISGIYGSVLA